MVDRAVFDITPHPQILTVLGEIEFQPWQCIAELVDNSIDGFLRMERAGTPIANPATQVAFGRDTVTIKDNGPGMSINELEFAVKAGWSTNEQFGNLGLYGVGFNIATARLGGLTTIWTTQAGSDKWYGLEVDLRKLSNEKHFKVDVKTRSKADFTQGGTEVEVTRIRSDWKDNLSSTPWVRSHITDRLARVYGTMLRDINPYPIKFSLYVNNRKVSAWEHCIWPEDLTVYRKDEGLVHPVQEIDENFPPKFVSRSTGEIYDTTEGLDSDDIMEIPGRVYGWIGIQRYADEKDFGIDILRNGRKIEVGCKDLFEWEKPDGEALLEYPIDDPRHRGRIVGEIHLDHGYVHYTKHRFEREHYSWNQLKQAVRHNEPLTHRAELNHLGINISPLGILFRTFRRNLPSASSKQTFASLLFIKDNEKAKTWAREFRKGNAEYRDNSKWQEELERSDGEKPSSNQADQNSHSQSSSEDFLFGSASVEETSASSQITSSAPIGSGTAFTEDIPSPSRPTSNGQSNSRPEIGVVPDTPRPGIGAIPDISRSSSTTALNENSQTQSSKLISGSPEVQKLISDLSVHIANIGISGKAYDIEVYEVKNDPFPKSAWTAHLTARGVYDIQVNIKHPAFNSTSLQVRDAVLAQVAYLITTEENSSSSRSLVNYSDILVELRNRYTSQESLDINHMRMEIDEIRRRLTRKLSEVLTEDQQKDWLNVLSKEDRQRILLTYARGPKSTSTLAYFEMEHLTKLLQLQPEVFFDKAHCFKLPWVPPYLDFTLLTEHQERVVRDVLNLTTVLGDFINDSISTQEQSRSYLALVRASINRLKELLSDE